LVADLILTRFVNILKSKNYSSTCLWIKKIEFKLTKNCNFKITQLQLDEKEPSLALEEGEEPTLDPIHSRMEGF
jgi:hypothetical protein